MEMMQHPAKTESLEEESVMALSGLEGPVAQ